MRSWIVLIYVLCCISLTSCAQYNSAQGKNVSKPIGETVKAPSEFMATKKVGNLPSEYTKSIIENELLVRGVKAADGYLVASNFEKGSISKYDLQGELVWNKDHITTSNGIYDTDSIAVAPDGGFIHSTIIRTYQNPDGTWVETDPVLERYDRAGNLLWSKTYQGFSDSTLQRIFCLSNGDIVTIGCAESKETKTTGIASPGDIYISKLDGKGNLISEGYFGGSSFEWLCDVEYIEGVGIAALISTQSSNGTFSASSNGYPVDVIAVFDSNLKLSWVKSLEVHLNPIMVVKDGNIFILDFANAKPGEAYCHYNLYKIDSKGSIVFKKDLGNSKSIRLVKGCSQGMLLKNENSLLILNMDGTEKLKLPFDAGEINKIIEYDDYFLVISTNVTGNLPQPPYISMRWQSTELVYSGYSYDGTLLWREAFDNTPESMKNYDPSKEE